ncbi:hypothetical protein KKB40_04925 [Patescibacteria group bacterium]|nr:hypothetical protein [Patescibacteria group bacterium]
MPKDSVPMARRSDYEALQGGRPKVIDNHDETVTITHDYPKGSRRVIRSRPIPDYGEVILATKQGPRKFKTGLVDKLHGEPCERQSLQVGGEGYDRISNS